jgi:DNA-binding transcriptional LysR family regulator
MVAILPSLLMAMQGDRHNVRAMPVPFEMPVLEERLYWHRRNDGDPGHVWMKQTLQDVAATLKL